MTRNRHAQRTLDALLERFAAPLDIAMPPAFRRAEAEPACDLAWAQGIEAERVRAHALLRQLRDAADGPAPAATAALHFGVTSCLDAADRWRGYHRRAAADPGRFALLARAELAARLACELRALADGSRHLDAAA